MKVIKLIIRQPYYVVNKNKGLGRI